MKIWCENIYDTKCYLYIFEYLRELEYNISIFYTVNSAVLLQLT